MSTSRYTTFISAAQLAALIASKPENIIIFDCSFDLTDENSGKHAYDAEHLPGAHYLHLGATLSGPRTGHNGRHPLPERTTLARALASYGLQNQHQVIAYDAQGGIFAARLWWLLRWLGHAAVALLDGGLHAWRKVGLPLSDTLPGLRAGDFKPAVPLAQTVDVDTVMRNLETHEYTLIDARSAGRYRGENETLDAVGGHIPGALNRFFQDNLTVDGHFKSAPVLRDEFNTLLGDKPAHEVILQCGSGVSACLHALAMEIASLPGAMLYPGSWSEWCSDPERPVATGSS
ncbi:sulfurtransferase [Mycoavidus sp. B2-EB]|uniref:sulfurtransferase n=1 Tax=Mycoavidus sp. B2-EB TaxID=2651972 RepID=UPI001624D2A8|nr:sulfurtransferase [Mycoavidus sp. B2-EB]BBO59832.1 sulfurtransferase [Mycoavidus sp. B2-EB]